VKPALVEHAGREQCRRAKSWPGVSFGKREEGESSFDVRRGQPRPVFGLATYYAGSARGFQRERYEIPASSKIRAAAARRLDLSAFVGAFTGAMRLRQEAVRRLPHTPFLRCKRSCGNGSVDLGSEGWRFDAGLLYLDVQSMSCRGPCRAITNAAGHGRGRVPLHRAAGTGEWESLLAALGRRRFPLGAGPKQGGTKR